MAPSSGWSRRVARVEKVNFTATARTTVATRIQEMMLTIGPRFVDRTGPRVATVGMVRQCWNGSDSRKALSIGPQSSAERDRKEGATHSTIYRAGRTRVRTAHDRCRFYLSGMRLGAGWKTASEFSNPLLQKGQTANGSCKRSSSGRAK